MKKMTEQEYMDREAQYGAHNYHPLPVVLEKGEGIYVWDVNGKRYFDFLSAYSAVNQGHCHPKIVEAMTEQAKKLALTSRAFYNNVLGEWEEYITKYFGYDKVLPMNSGAEADETALKLCRRWGYDVKGIPADQAKIIVCDNNFHGRTITIVTLSNDPSSYAGFGPFTPGFVRIPYDDIPALEEALKDPNVAGFLLEPIQGEAGVIVPPEGYLTELRQICDEYGVALIFDEIQTGMGRTGTMWRCEAEGVTPDIMTFGKAFGGGIMPITGIICKPSMWVQQLIDNPWLLGSPTFGGNPVCCSAAIATIKYMIDNDIPGQCASKGKILKAGLESLKAKYPEIIDDVRGVGLMLAVEFVTSDIGYSIAKGLFSRGVMTAGTLVNSKCIRFEPTAVITEEQIAAVIERMDAALADTKKEYNL